MGLAVALLELTWDLGKNKGWRSFSITGLVGSGSSILHHSIPLPRTTSSVFNVFSRKTVAYVSPESSAYRSLIFCGTVHSDSEMEVHDFGASYLFSSNCLWNDLHRKR